jgi:hypothetical protein
MIAPGSLCWIHNPIEVWVPFFRHLNTWVDGDRIYSDEHTFTIISVPHKDRDGDVFAWGLLDGTRLCFIKAMWLIEVREGDK